MPCLGEGYGEDAVRAGQVRLKGLSDNERAWIARDQLVKNGGAGIAQTVTVFGPMLLKAGVSDTTLRHILVDNARRFLAFVPKA